MKHFLLITNQGKPEALALAQEVRQKLEGMGCTVSEQVEDDTECVLVLGGDGTLLQAARDLRDQELPFLGINAGTLGYLAEVDREHVDEALELLTSGQVVSAHRMMLQGQIIREGRIAYEDVALNDIAIGSRGLVVMYFKLYVDGEYLTTYQADGMVVATPTGSTAYNLSAGGPIVNPQASLIVLTPVSPHTLMSRSVVLGSDSVVELEIIDHPTRRGTEGCVSFDGNEVMVLHPSDRVRISRSDRTTSIIRFNKGSFLEILRKKMGDR